MTTKTARKNGGKMKAYTIALLGALAALGGAGCSDDSAYWESHYRQKFAGEKTALESRVTGEVERRERAACDGRLSELRQQLAPREASGAGSATAEGGEGEAAYQYPDANQPMHALLTGLTNDRYIALDDTGGWETQEDGLELYIGNEKACARRPSEVHQARQAADGGAPPVCLVNLNLKYNRRDNTFSLDYARNGAADPTGVRFDGTGQRLRWEDITAVTKYAGSGEGSNEIRLTPADAAAQYHPVFDTQLGRLQTEADRALAELMRPPTVE